jgi:hypothetical protein
MAEVWTGVLSTSDGSVTLNQQLRRAAPDRLVEVADEFIRGRLGGLRSDVLMADYRIAGLWSVRDAGHPDQGSLAERPAAARCFSGQQPVLDRLTGEAGLRLHVPLTAWGERLGVLLVDLPEAATTAQIAGIRGIAGDLAVALRAADRDTDRYRRARRRERLSLAAELQWDLIPGRSVGHDAYLLAGQLEPAYTVGGDNFDWAVNGDLLTVTALNGDGTGLSASLLTTLAAAAGHRGRLLP